MGNDYRFGPAQTGENIVFGARRPGYPSESVALEQVHKWIDYMIKKGIRRVCCLLPPDQLAYYDCDLIEVYEGQFERVCTAPVDDYHLCEPSRLDTEILPFLVESDQANEPVVVHCSGGSGRTGHILAAWLVRRRLLSVEEALDAVAKGGRNPREAVLCGNATEDELRQLLRGH